MVDINKRTDLFYRFIDFTKERYSYLKQNNVHSLTRALFKTSQTFHTEVTKGVLKNTTEVIAFLLPYNFGQPCLLDQGFSEEPQEVGYLFFSLYSLDMITELNFTGASKPSLTVSIFILRPGSGGGKDLVQVKTLYNFKRVSIIDVHDCGVYKILSARFLKASYSINKYEDNIAKGQKALTLDYTNFTTDA